MTLNFLCKWSLNLSLISAEADEDEANGVGGVYGGVKVERAFGGGRVKAPPPSGCCPGVAWQRKQVFCTQGEILEEIIHNIAGETVQPVKVEDGKACDAGQE